MLWTMVHIATIINVQEQVETITTYMLYTESTTKKTFGKAVVM